MTPEERERRKDLVDVMETRRMESDRFAWAVPTVAIASQAFLLTIALDGDASAPRRFIAASAALVTLAGAAHLFWKQAFGFALYEAVIKRERKALGLPRVDRNSLLEHADTLEERFQDEWLEKHGGSLVKTDGPGGYYQPKWLVRRRAVRVWLAIFVLIALLDVGLAVWAVYDGRGWDWFGSDPGDFRFDDD